MVEIFVQQQNSNEQQRLSSSFVEQSKYMQMIIKAFQQEQIKIYIEYPLSLIDQADQLFHQIIEHEKHLNKQIINNIQDYMKTEHFKQLFKNRTFDDIKKILEIAEFFDIELLLVVVAAYVSIYIQEKYK